MKCPTDDTTLQLAERHGIEIDYCPTCRGVCLDRGELDKIIERVPGPGRPDDDRDLDRSRRRDRDLGFDGDFDDRAYAGGGRRKRKRGGFLGELFEFGD